MTLFHLVRFDVKSGCKIDDDHAPQLLSALRFKSDNVLFPVALANEENSLVPRNESSIAVRGFPDDRTRNTPASNAKLQKYFALDEEEKYSLVMGFVNRMAH